MHRSATFMAALALSLTALLVANTATAAVVSYTSDADFLANAGFTKVFGANSRWGNNALDGDWEYAIVDATDTPIGTPGQVHWDAHNVHEVHFTYDGEHAKYILCDHTIFGNTDEQPIYGGPGINALALRGRAGADDTALLFDVVVTFKVDGSSVILHGLMGDADAEYQMLIDDRLAGGFTLSAIAALVDEGVPTTAGSIPMYGLKLGTTVIPVPAAAWLFGSGLGLLGWLRRRSR